MARIPTQPTTESGLPALVPHGRFKGKPVMHLGRPVTVIGARARSHLHLVSPSVSKSHAMVVNTGAGFYVRDLASRTHIYVNGQQIKEAELKDGDILAVGPFTFRFTDPGRSSGTRATPPGPGVLRASDRALPVSLDSRVTMIGRRPTCEIAVDESEVSTTHAVVFEMNGKRFIRDLGSRTGTFVNGTAVHQQPLEFGDTVRVGSVELVYADAADELAGVGSELPDEDDDLAGTARLSAQELDQPTSDRPAARAAAVAPRGADVITNDNGHIPVDTPSTDDELDLSLEPALGTDGDGVETLSKSAEPPVVEPPASIPLDEEAVDDLTVTPLTPEPEAAAPAPTIEPSALDESSIGIELLPHDAAEAATAPPAAPAAPVDEPAGLSGLDLEPTADHAPTPAAGETDFGLDFAEPAAPSIPATPVAAVQTPEASVEPDVLDLTDTDEADLALDLEPVDLDRLEVVEKTEPTPESANALGDVLPLDDAAAAARAQPPAGVDSMTDSVFGREVEAFEGPGLGPLVEAQADEPSTASDPLIYEDPADAAAAEAPAVSEPASDLGEPTGEAPEGEAAQTKRRGGRKPAAAKEPKAAKKPAAPKRKAPARKSPKAAAAEAAEAIPADMAAGVEPVSAEPLGESTVDAPLAPESAPETVAPGLAPIEPQGAEGVAAEIAAEPPAPDAPELAFDALPEPIGADLAVAEAHPASVDDEIAPVDAEVVNVPATLDLPDEEAPAPELGIAEPPTLDLDAEEPVAAEIDLAGPPSLADATEPPARDESLGTSAFGDTAEIAPEPALGETLEGPTGEVQEPVAERAAPAGEAGAPPAPGKPADLFFGLERDTASFLGGMPLQLPPLQSPFAPQTRVDFTRPPLTNLRTTTGETEEPDEPEMLSVDDDDLADLDADTGTIAPEAEAPVDLDLDDADADVAPPAAPAVGGTAPAARTSPFRPAPPPPARSGGQGRERSARPGQAGAPAAPGEPGGTPQRPAALSSPFDLNFEDSPTDRIEIPPFAGPGPATRGHVTTAFDGLAMPPVREADVFSQRPAGGDTAIPPFAGLSGGGGAPQPGATDEEDVHGDFGDDDQEPLDLSTADDDLGEASADDAAGGDDDGAVAAELAEDQQPGAGEARKSWQPLSPARRPPAYPTEPAGGRPAPKKKKRWRIGKWGLFGLMLITMGVAALAILYAWPAPTATVTGKIEFTRLDQLPEAQRQQVLAEQRIRLQRPEVRASAREILGSNFGGIAPGFLAETGTPDEVKATAAAFMKITGNLRLVEKKPVILVEHHATDGEGDQRRMLALLHALYADNKPLIDAEGELAKALDKKQAELMQAQIEFRAMQPAMDEARSQLGDRNVVAQQQGLVDALQQNERKLSAAWNEATARVKQLTANALAVESAVPFDPDAKAEDVPPAPDEDPLALEMARRAEDLAKKLAAAKQRRAAKAEEARKVMATALKKFEDDIAKARAEMKPDTELGRYLTAAAEVQSQLKIVSGELAQQQRSDMERLAMLKQKLAEKNEARIRRAFAGDPELQSMQEQLALKERQFNTASRGGLRDDAKKLEKEVKSLRLEIESRQDLLTTADGVAPDMKDLEAFIGETLARMEKDRARNDRNMAERLKGLAAKAPAAGSLPEEQKAFATQLERRQAELNEARQGYAAAVEAAAADVDEDVKDVETELAAVQAKLDERKKQVAEAARKSLTQDQQKARVAVTTVSRRNLDRAQEADEKAAANYLANRRALADAEEQLERVKKRTESFNRGNAKATAAQQRMVALGEKVEDLRKQVEASIVPVKPGDDHVALAPQAPDRRVTYVLGTCLLLALVYGPLVAAAPLHPKRGADPEGDAMFGEPFDAHANGDAESAVPFAAPAARHPDEPALAAARAAETATDDEHRAREDESPVPV